MDPGLDLAEDPSQRSAGAAVAERFASVLCGQLRGGRRIGRTLS